MPDHASPHHSNPPRWGTVTFAGGRGGDAPMTWGQLTTWDDIQYFMPESKSFYFVRQDVRPPDAMSLDDVLCSLGDLMDRHETLRTHFVEDERGPRQWVVASGAARALVLEVGAGDPFERAKSVLAGLDVEFAGLTTRPFDHARELPLRLAVLTAEGAPVGVVLLFSRLAVDMESARLVEGDLTCLLTARAEGRPLPPADFGVPPLDDAGFERSERGRRSGGRALRALERQLECMPESMTGPVRPGGSPRYWRGELTSRALPPAVYALARRLGVSSSAVLFGTVTALLAALSGRTGCTLGIVHGNRSTTDRRRSVGSLAQTVTTTVRTDAADFAGHLRTTATGMLGAYLCGRFDPRAAADLVREVTGRRGSAPDLACRFNDMWSWRSAPHADRLAEVAAVADGVREAALRSEFRWVERTDLDKITFFVDIAGDADAMRLLVLADTWRTPPAEVEAFLRGCERLVLAALASPAGGPAMSEVPAAAGWVPLSPAGG
ncbi:hypothetical protein [Streptomyces sp. NPDC058486]|uniref:hypothetical protein n=1 Tax=unclassified Streptomyces TaxID=2593676 RepID=UPI00364F0FC6